MTEPLQGWTPITPRALFLLTGADRVRYLNGQITQQVDHLTKGQARYAVITNHKGQLEADLYFAHHPETEGILIDAHIDLRQSLFTRLDRYIIADDAELTDITDDWQVAHVLDQIAPTEDDSFHIQSNRFGQPGTDVWISNNHDLDQLLQTRQIEQLSPQLLENHRITQGIPKWNHELTPGLLPPEARIEARAIDYQKGCYIGQEIISRIKSVGKVNRRLVLLQLDDSSNSEIDLPCPLWPSTEEQPGSKAIGTLTSISKPDEAQPPTAEVLALGYLKSQHAEAGTQVLAAPTMDAPNATQLTVLPFIYPTSS